MNDLAETLGRARRIVVKLGTQIVVDAEGRIAATRIAAFLQSCAELRARGREVLLVSSGAVGVGRATLGGPGDDSLRAKQAYAAVGQARLVEVYREILDAHGLHVAQVLLTSDDFGRRRQFLNARDTLETLLRMGVVPLINENDTVSTEELEPSGRSHSFGDNDVLSALVAGNLGADLLVILTDVDGVHDANPRLEPGARRIPVLADAQAIASVDSDGKSELGRGGIRSKLEAARIASACGVATWITSGLRDDALAALADASRAGEQGTIVLPRARLAQRKQWIAFSSGYRGTVTVNAGAEKALVEGRGSLLPVGITRVDGSFEPGDTIRIQSEAGAELGRGLSEFHSKDLRRVQGLRSDQIEAELGEGCEVRVVHRNHLVMF